MCKFIRVYLDYKNIKYFFITFITLKKFNIKTIQKMKKIITFIIILIFAFTGFSQNESNKPAKATYFGKSTSMRIVPSLASRAELIPAEPTRKEPQDGRSSKNKIIIGKDPQTKNDFLASNPHPLTQKIQGRAPNFTFEVDNNVGPPSDPALAVGPNHVMIVYNTGFSIYDKNGIEILGPLAVTNIFSGGGCCDLTISYDNAADRWVMTYLYIGNGIEVAVSDGPDPETANWFVYSIPQVNDYNKLSVWSDGYYVTDNTNATNKIYALERDEMLAGNPSAQIVGFPLPGIATSGFFSPQALNVTNDNLPAAGGATFIYLQDDAWTGVAQDHIKLWTLDVDWVTPGNSTISAAQTINTTPFISVFDGGSFSNLTQPGGGDIDALQATIMNQAQFRKFAGHNSAIFNFVVDTDVSNGELAGVRWYELRQSGDNQPWSLYQEGTYTAPDGRHAWMGSMAMDVQGNIAMGYTSMSGPTTPTTVRVSSYYTGRFANDALGTMTIAEEVIANGTGNVGGFRYGDYSKLDVDPIDDKTFWFINEYIRNGGKDIVGVFKIAPNFDNDTGVVNIDSPTSGTLSANEDVVVTIFNYGENSQTNIPVNLTVDGLLVATGTYTSTIASSSSDQFTFTGIDFSIQGHTYTVEACTELVTDEDSTNDCSSTEITYLDPNDIGISAITSPISGTDLTATESITVTITNFGGNTQSNFDVTYVLDGGTPVIENVPGPLDGNSDLTYTFMQTGDFIAIGNHNLSVTTSLTNDSDTSNDELSVVITKTVCQPALDCSEGDGFQLFQVGTINNTSGCDGGYSDFTAISTDLNQNSTNSLTVRTSYGNQFVRVWIDFNDDFSFTTDEIVVDNFILGVGNGSGSYTETTDLIIPTGVALGSHVMRAKTRWSSNVPDDACDAVGFGETEDYTVNIVEALNVENNLFNDANFIVSSLENNQFNISVLTTDINERLTFTVTNMIGQKLLSYNLDNENGGYSYDLDMSYATPGVYILRLGSSKLGNTKKIIVK